MFLSNTYFELCTQNIDLSSTLNPIYHLNKHQTCDNMCLIGADSMQLNVKRLKLACYMSNITMSVVGNLSPLLFVTFRELYGISYSLLGTLVLINFVTQLGIDLIFSFFSHKFNIPLTVKLMPCIAAVGIVFYAVTPWLMPNSIYFGLAIGTVIFSLGAGLGEVLISPTIAALPADDPDHEMSKLHSVYAWGVVFFVVIFTLFIKLLGRSFWQWLVFGFTLIPILAAVLFSNAQMPITETPEKVSGALHQLKNKALWLCVIAIFLGGASEVTMAQWASGYLEQSLGIPKIWGDIFGVAMFAVALGIGRTLYSKIGKNITKVLLLGAIGAVLCYLTAAMSNIAIVGLLACAFTGFCTSMMWPGSLIVASDKLPHGGVFMFALMAAGGDLGASVGPQLVGVITDAALELPTAIKLADALSLTPEQLGMKLGMLCGMFFPLIGVFVYMILHKNRRKNDGQIIYKQNSL